MSKSLFERHIRKPVEFAFIDSETGTEDTFLFKPLNMEQIQMATKIGKITKECGQESPEVVGAMFELFRSIIKESYPDLDDQTIDNFVTSNISGMARVLEELSPRPDVEKLKEKGIIK